ncbi:tigger transposable element-derived protein 1-like [Homarus americanus]|uniref:tigger transposable element-derived protein 1-like n=1 Tax=Homarus americanus TaxID=6706 RepID=UPI001C48BBE7|nr:tigger transposable element-derived protein 1-like [Homarus americanus]
MEEEEGASSEVKPFLASKGWFERSKKSLNLHNIKMSGEAASADTDSANTYPAELKKIIDEGGYTPEQVYYVDETGLFWKRMPARTFISTEEKSAPGFKASKDRLTLLLGGNASGDMKLKPLLVYHSENPGALKGYAKSNLPVIWHSNKKAWMTMTLYQDWFTNYFCPAVERYNAKRRNISNKALLLIDNEPSHPVNLNDLSDNVRVEYIPKNTTSLLQPMDQGVIANFKAYYLRKTFLQLIKAIDGEDKPTIRDFWKKFNILDAVDNIAESWDEVKTSAMNGKTYGQSVSMNLKREEGLQIFADNDPNRERNIKIARAVNNALSSYTELYKEKVRVQDPHQEQGPRQEEEVPEDVKRVRRNVVDEVVLQVTIVGRLVQP